jgi:exopolyphosphatase/guanosine-5'-triphosphate,3'-diphosphate pyrophosphatase
LRPPIKPVPAARFVTPQGVKQQFAAAGTGGTANGASANTATSNAGSGGFFAALDLGTNNCRLLVAAPREANRFKVVDAFSRIIRLGEGLGQTGRLSDEAMDRAFDALSVCASKLASHPIAGMRLIATQACRIAANGEEFLNRVYTVTGLKLEIVDRETEARLAAEGCGSLMDYHAEGAVLFDIGGGSSELILVNRKLSRSRRISHQIAGWTSLPLGVVTLSERHGGRQVSRSAFDGMVDEVLTHLEAFDGRHSLAEIWGQGRTHLPLPWALLPMWPHPLLQPPM